MSRLNNLRMAADDSAQRALQKIDTINVSQFQKLISELKRDSVDIETISQLESTISDATRRNKLVADLIEKGGSIGKQIAAIVCKLV
jgi:hypothetical protein